MIPENEKEATNRTIYENTFDISKLREKIVSARTARCRTRFPIPVILYRGKYICRSSTLSGGSEIYGRSMLETILGSTSGVNAGASSSSSKSTSTSTYDTSDASLEDDAVSEQFDFIENGAGAAAGSSSSSSSNSTVPDSQKSNSGDWVYMNQIRNNDIQLIKYLHVDVIVDLMVENKKVKYGLK